MAREFPIWVIVLLPWLAALLCVLVARPGVRVLGPRRASSLAHYLGLGASALALLFTVQAIQHLLAPDDPRALAHTPLGELIGPIVIGELRIDATLVADRLSTCAALLVSVVFVLARMFVAGPAGQRALGLRSLSADPSEAESGATVSALRWLALLGLLEGAALLFVLASDLGLAALGWALLGAGSAVAVARGAGDERRASAATRVLALGVAGDLALGAALLTLIVSGIGLAHNNLWAPLTGDHLYAAVRGTGVSFADLIALGLAGAALLRLSSVVWSGDSLAEALLDAVLIPVPAIYLVLRYQRVLSYAPSVLAGLLVVGILIALSAAAIGLVRPSRGQAHDSPRSGSELGLAGTGLAWVGLIAMALGVGAWRTAALLVLAQALGRLGLRLALLVGDGGQLPTWTARVGRLLVWAVAGIAPGLGFVALGQTLVDVLTRASLLAPWISWLGAVAVILVAFMFAAGVARIWYEGLGPKPGAEPVAGAEDEDGLDFGPLLLIFAALVVLGVAALGSWFDVLASPIAWLDKVLPLAGGHEAAPTGLREGFRDGGRVARPWIAGSGVLLALVTGFAWMWTRERFRRASGDELSGLSSALELSLSYPRRAARLLALLLTGLTELAARGVGRGVFEEGLRVARSLVRDIGAGLAPRLRRLSPGGGRQALLGLVLGLGLLFGWLYANPEAASVGPSDNYGFGGLRAKLIRAGGSVTKPEPGEAPPSVDPGLEARPPSPMLMPPPAPRSDGAEPGPLPLPEGR
ncbi:NADH:ubiquinone oxidoreductase subunit L [Enhygromyxa salina]|uniref:NADH:ubiquinone oxidoreductase subunit L n=1 Tax=Enhygromyxa salina TaxID=215803 RepID=A0A2S9YAM5_9BACT|nr:hypothetical protein [Enhygromyxa salina]PRQ02071.1 NADH:ubiquinone oxidoreductase subunit L [Enhygromyxa salina]